VTGLLSTCGAQFQDWTASYRLFSRLRFDSDALFSGIRSGCLQQAPDSAAVCLSVDDSLLPKRGAKTPGVAWRRDPQGPPFQTNLIRAQRVLQFSALVPVPNSQAVRAIPIDFLHAPTPPKLPKDASPQQKKEHKQLAESLNLATRALQQWKRMKSAFAGRRVILLSDARFTTQRFLKGLPNDVTLIGRLRKDAKLFYLPAQQPSTGRRRRYGAPAPTPEQIRQDPASAWQEIPVHAAGADHTCRIKVVDQLLWRPAGAQRVLRLVVIAPLAYRPRKGSRIRYRDPAFLICTDPALPAEQIVQQYFRRWDIEVNFRDQKTLLGVGQPQVHHSNSCQSVPALQVAAYALLLLAASRLHHSDLLPPPKWRARQCPERHSTQRLLRNLRFEVWGRGLGLSSFSGFSCKTPPAQNSEKLLHALPSALFYA
jgi:hypothetical protein